MPAACENELERWTDTSSSPNDTNSSKHQHQLQLLVPPGQLELGCRLITSMYANTPDLSDLSPQQLVQLAALAECYQVVKVVAAAGQALGRLGPDQHTAQIVALLYELPASCLELHEFKEVKSSAQQFLQQQFGDLEVTWADRGRQVALLQLPFAAVKQLLENPDTAVASEDTVFYTIDCWLKQHPNLSEEQLQQLAGLVRLLHCTFNFMTSVAAADASWLLRAGYTAKDLTAAGWLKAKGVQQHLDLVDKLYSQRGAWKQPARPASSKSVSCTFDWDLPLSELQAVFETSSGAAEVVHQVGVWQGHSWNLDVDLPSPERSLGLYVFPGTACCFSARAVVLGTTGGRLARQFYGKLVQEGQGKGWSEFVPSTKGLTSWSALEAELRKQQLVHPDGCLHLQVKIFNLS